MTSTRKIMLLLGAALAVSACGTAAPSLTTVGPPGSAGQASSPAAASASPARATPSATPAVAARCEAVAKLFDANRIELSGPWAGDDGGIYYLRQLGSVLWWNGMSDRAGSPSGLGRGWNNVARGEITGLVIDVAWADVPRGRVLGDGTLNLKIEADATGKIRIVKVSETGAGFGNNTWTPCSPG